MGEVMATIDIRDGNLEPVTGILFGVEYVNQPAKAVRLSHRTRREYGRDVYTIDIVAPDTYVEIHGKADAEYLIIALRKAIELGWVK